MAEIVKITCGQPFVVYLPLVILNADGSKEAVDASRLTDVVVKLQAQGMDDVTVTTEAYEQYLVLNIPGTMPVAEYNIIVNATLASGRLFTLRMSRALGVMAWDWQTNWRDYLVGEHIDLCDQPFIAGEFTTDAEYEALKQQLRLRIAEAEQAEAEAIAEKERYAEALEHLDDVAKQGDNPAATSSAILEALSHINPQDPNSKALAEFFGVTLLQGYEFMTDTEVTDELEDIMQALDPELEQEVEYPEGSGTYMTKAQAITAEAMQIINPSQS